MNGIIIQGYTNSLKFFGDSAKCISKILQYSINFNGYISEISVVVATKEQDKYGNDKDSAVAVMSFKMSELEKINWEKFKVENLAELAELYEYYK